MKKNLMKFNKGKFRVLHKYSFGADLLDSISVEKDLWDQVDTKLTVSHHYLCRKGSMGPGGHQVDREPSMCPCGQEGQGYPGLH